MDNGTQISTSKNELTFRCTMTIPRAGLSECPAVATSFDRWGAILHLDAQQMADLPIDVDDTVELDLMLPGHHAYGRRAMHCLGRAIQTSRDVNGQLWLVVRFHQLQIRALTPASGAAARMAAPHAERADRGHGAVE